jgi:ParB family chromosome partitioning protein
MKKSLNSLSGILPDFPLKTPEPEELNAGLFIPLDAIQPDPDQPRKLSADADEDLKLLASSIEQHGVLQPIAVKALPNGKYQIIAGERRWRAARMALASGNPCARKGYDLKRIPVFIRDPENDTDRLEMQMVENLARADMSPSDIGRALQKLLDATKVSKAELARRLGRSDTWVKSVLASASPEAAEVAQQIGVDPELLGAGESMRLISWSKDAEKRVVLDWIAKAVSDGVPFNRGLMDEKEDRYEAVRRFPQLIAREDLSAEDLRTFTAFWGSPDAAKRAVANRILNGAGVADAMVAVDEPQEAEETAPPPQYPDVDDNTAEYPLHRLAVDFEADDAEVVDAAAAREGLTGNREKPQSAPDRVVMDNAGMSMEAAGSAPVADTVDKDMTIRLPGRIIQRLLEKAGIAYDLTVDQDTLIDALDALLQ